MGTVSPEVVTIGDHQADEPATSQPSIAVLPLYSLHTGQWAHCCSTSMGRLMSGCKVGHSLSKAFRIPPCSIRHLT